LSTRKIVLYLLAGLVVLGIGNFLLRSFQIRQQLARVASNDPAAQTAGIKNLMGRGALFDALQGGAPKETRLKAVETLEKMADNGADKSAFEQLLQMLKDPDTESAEAKTHPVRDRARDAVAKVGVFYPERLLGAAKDQDGAIKDQSREALRKIGAPLMNQMAARLGDNDLRAPLGDILANNVGPQTVALVTPYLQPDKLNPDGKKKPEDLVAPKVQLIEILGKYKVPAATDPKVTPEQRAQAVAQVADAARAIVPFKDDADPNVRRTVVTSLSNLANDVAGPVLIAALTSPTTDPDARAAAAGALGAIATPEANAAMIAALGDVDLRVARAAAAGLRRAGDKASQAIAGALANPDPAVRALAADATAGQTSPALAARALKDPDPQVRASAASALGDLALALGNLKGARARARPLRSSRPWPTPTATSPPSPRNPSSAWASQPSPPLWARLPRATTPWPITPRRRWAPSAAPPFPP
jgi:HEAT repeat protein